MLNAHEEILGVLQKRMRDYPDVYINPHFMQLITEAIYNYYITDDEELDAWIADMFGH